MRTLATAQKQPAQPRLPAYAGMMAAYHQAFAPELKAIIDELPLDRARRVLDFACGDGSYSGWLADRVGAEGEVVALDISPAFLAHARQGLRRARSAAAVRFVQADIRNLPLADGGVDLAWCAQSLYSLPDPVQALRQMARTVRPGGHVAVLENDELHHVVFPWPVEIELALRQAELASFVESSERPRKYYVGRDLCRLFRAAGLRRCQARGVVFTRQAPLDRPARAFFTAYLKDLERRTRPHLEPSLRTLFRRLASPRSRMFLLSAPDLTITCMNHVVVAVKPGGRRSGKRR